MTERNKPPAHERFVVDGDSFTEDLGPVRLPTRDELLADARRGQWREIGPGSPVPMDRPTIVTRQTRGDAADWVIQRFDPALPHQTLYIHGLLATHWAEDTLGTPVV